MSVLSTSSTRRRQRQERRTVNFRGHRPGSAFSILLNPAGASSYLTTKCKGCENGESSLPPFGGRCCPWNRVTWFFLILVTLSFTLRTTARVAPLSSQGGQGCSPDRHQQSLLSHLHLDPLPLIRCRRKCQGSVVPIRRSTLRTQSTKANVSARWWDGRLQQRCARLRGGR